MEGGKIDEDEDDELIECLETQTMEIEAMKCIFPNESEFEIANPLTLREAKAICEKFRSASDKDLKAAILKQAIFLGNISLDFKIAILYEVGSESDVEATVNVNFSLPPQYPCKDPPCVYLSADSLSREQQRLWNVKLNEYLNDNNTGDQMIYQVLEWLRESGEDYLKASTKQLKSKCATFQSQDSQKEPDTAGSLWLYMHHIYNKEKRKDIINWANELSLTGFSLPGKPGIVHVEGTTQNVEEYFVRLRRLSWKRMSCVHREKYCPRDWIRKFDSFEELCFDAHGGRDYHMDMGKFNLFLKDHKLDHMFTILFGLKKNENS